MRPVRIDPRGEAGPTKGQADGPNWRRTSYGFYVPSSVDGTVPEQRIIEQSVRLPKGGAVTGWGACRLHGAAFFDGLGPDRRARIPVPLATGPRGNLRKDAAVSLSRERLAPEDIVVVAGITCTRVLRALFDEMRRTADLREAVVAMDMMAAAELVSIGRMRVYAADRAGWKFIRQVYDALDLADENSRSPNETRMRLVWQLDAGFPQPLVNQHMWDLHGNLLGIADILDPVAGLVGEFDGADHRGALRHSKDVDREARFRDHDLELFRVTGLDMRDRRLIVRRMASSRSRAKWLSPEQRSWTIVPPPDREPAPSLDAILDERDFRWSLYEQWEREGSRTEQRGA